MNDEASRRGRSAWGAVFLVIGLITLLDRLDVFDLRARYLLPIVLLATGLAVLVTGIAPRRR